MVFPLITSPKNINYNCIAWAADEDTRWGDPSYDYFWPENISRDNTLESFIAAYETLGYERCNNEKLELGFKKIAIYIKDKKPTHAARQLPNGNWTSKLGASFDIEHKFINNWTSQKYWLDTEFFDLSSYGMLGCILKKHL
jgi:hypothetical protein